MSRVRGECVCRYGRVNQVIKEVCVNNVIMYSDEACRPCDTSVANSSTQTFQSHYRHITPDWFSTAGGLANTENEYTINDSMTRRQKKRGGGDGQPTNKFLERED